MLERSELAAWLHLTTSPGLGRAAARRLLALAGSPAAALELPDARLGAALDAVQRAAWRAGPPDVDALVARHWAWLQAGAGRDLLVLGDPDYPTPLLQTADPPLLLWLHGRRELLARPMLAVVGSRNPSAQGVDHAHAFAAALADAGLLVASGLALGIDGAAHAGALARGAPTLAVVGTGLDRIYPRANAALWRRIATEGLIVGEYALGTPPLAQNFPQRNRILAGLARGCLVVEAGLRSGSLITARLAAEAGREVYAIPGSIHAPQSRGCHVLLREGAKLVETVADVLEELPRARPALAFPDAPDATLAPGPRRVLERMGFDPIGFDALLARATGTPEELAAWLLELELDGHVARLAGQLFQRRGRT